MLGLALVVLSAAWLFPTAAHAVAPRSGTYVMHDHGVRGQGWHIELRVGSDARFLRQLVLHSERCDETVLTTRVRIREGGRIASSKPFTTTDGGQGSWRLEAQWVARNQVMGSFQVSTSVCDGGERRFSARLVAKEHADDGHEAHHHGGHATFGTPIGSYPDLAAGSEAVRTRLEGLRAASLRAASERFSTYENAVAAGFKRWPRAWTPPLVFHLRHAGYERDRHDLDPRRPESLVYWWPPDGPPILIAFMFRKPLRLGWPRFGRPLLGWHSHQGGEDATLMTHLWMTGDLRSAIANCMPVPALEAAVAGFRFQPIDHDLTQESVPCLEAEG